MQGKRKEEKRCDRNARLDRVVCCYTRTVSRARARIHSRTRALVASLHWWYTLPRVHCSWGATENDEDSRENVGKRRRNEEGDANWHWHDGERQKRRRTARKTKGNERKRLTDGTNKTLSRSSEKSKEGRRKTDREVCIYHTSRRLLIIHTRFPAHRSESRPHHSRCFRFLWSHAHVRRKWQGR